MPIMSIIMFGLSKLGVLPLISERENYRINFVYRFEVGPKLKPYLDYTDIKQVPTKV
jgi:hypothetical protein